MLASRSAPLFSLIQGRRWLEVYKRILLNTIHFGLILFFGAIYIYPNDSGMEQTFYLLVVLPFLLLLPIVFRDLPWRKKYFYLYMAFPLYMFTSYFWASKDVTTREWVFFFKILLYFFVFFGSVYLVTKYNENFYSNLLGSQYFFGSISVGISIVLHVNENYRAHLTGFSIMDINKAGAIYAIHAIFCLREILRLGNGVASNILKVMALLTFILDLVAIYFTHSIADKFVVVSVLVFPMSLYLAKTNMKYFLIFGLFVMACAVCVSGFVVENTSVIIRLAAWENVVVEQLRNHYLFGLGLVYKLPYEVFSLNEYYTFLHPHNMFVDTLRFGGLIGLLGILIHLFLPLIPKFKRSFQSVNQIWLLSWLAGGVLMVSCYGQQPFVRPGSYIWFFYWMPLTLLYVENLNPTIKTEKSKM